MTAAQVYRASGWSLVVGAIVSFVTLLYAAVVFIGSTEEVAKRPEYLWVNVFSAVGVALLLLGLPGWFGSRASVAGITGLIGMICIFLTGIVLGVFLSLLEGLIFPYLAAQAPQLIAGEGPPSMFGVFISGTILNLAGAVLLAVAVLRAKIDPVWTGYVWILCAIMAIVGFVIGGPSATNAVTSIIGISSALLIFIALFGFGVDLLARCSSDMPASGLKGRAQEHQPLVRVRPARASWRSPLPRSRRPPAGSDRRLGRGESRGPGRARAQGLAAPSAGTVAW